MSAAKKVDKQPPRTDVASKSDNQKAFVAAYDKIVATARMQDIRLVKYEFEIKPQFYQHVAANPEVSPKLSFDHSFANIHYSADDQLLLGEIHWTVSGKFGRSTPLKILAVFLVAYANVPAVGENAPEEFMKRVGRFAAYPYFRSMVAQSSWASMIDLPILPILR